MFTQQWMLVEIKGVNKMYTTKRYKRAYSVLDLKVLSTCLARGMIFENIGFFKRKILHLLKKYAEDCFEVIHVKYCVRMYLVFVFPKGQYESKYGSESDSMKKEKQNNRN